MSASDADRDSIRKALPAGAGSGEAVDHGVDRGASGRAMRRGLKLRHFAPLAGFVLPTVVIGYGVVIPRSCIAGLNELTLGFAATVVGACLTYWAGLRLVARRGNG
jgi:hypothetical protein